MQCWVRPFEKLAQMRQAGLLNDEEFAAAQAKRLG